MRVYNIHCPPAGAVLDREEDDTLILVITAEDHGSPENTGSVTMTITLLDENDNPPTFVPPFGYAVVAPEDEPVGSVLLVPVSVCPSPLYICHLHTLLQAATDPDLFGGGQISFRKATSSPLSKLSCFSVNRYHSMYTSHRCICMYSRRYSPSIATELLPIWSPCLV